VVIFFNNCSSIAYFVTENLFMGNIVIAIHGGAGTILRSAMTPEREKAYQAALTAALHAGYDVLKKGNSSLDAVQAAVIALEDSPLFNAGKGSVFTHDGSHEMDASVMEGRTLMAGAVAGVQNVKNPVLLARTIMDESEYVFLSGKGAEEFAVKKNIQMENDDYFFDKFRYDQLIEIRGKGTVQLDHSDKKFGTVGAVATDVHGNLAAATSTGGMTNKHYNRIGDTPMIGSGNYANNNTCAVSCTGHGEYFIRAVVAYDVSCLMEYKGLSLKDACNQVVHDKLLKIGGEGGLVAVDRNGNYELVFNSEGMYRGFKNETEENVMIYK
jgi:beta-aspartyl-peptidase (threonine type)